MFRIAIAMVLFLSAAALGQDARIWRIEIQGTYEGIDGDKVRIKNAQGKVLTLNISMLCAEDKQYIQQKLGLGTQGTRTKAPKEPQATKRKSFTFQLVTGEKLTGRMVTFGEDKFSIGRRAGKVYVGRMVDGKPQAAAYENLKGYDKAVVDEALKAKGLGTVDEYTKKLGLKAETVKYPTVTIATGAEAEQVHPIHMLIEKQAAAVRTIHGKWLAEQPPQPKEPEGEPDLRSFINRAL